MSYRRRDDRRHYDSNSSDTEYSEPDESRKSCIKRSKYDKSLILIIRKRLRFIIANVCHLHVVMILFGSG